MKDPGVRAKRARTLKQAARLHQSLESELALNANLPLSWTAEAEAALRDLEARYGREILRDPDTAGGNNGWIPSLSRDARRGLDLEFPDPDRKFDWVALIVRLVDGTRWRVPVAYASIVIMVTLGLVIVFIVLLGLLGLVIGIGAA